MQEDRPLLSAYMRDGESEPRSCRKACVLALIVVPVLPLSLVLVAVGAFLGVIFRLMGAFTKERKIKFAFMSVPVFLCEFLRQNLLYHLRLINQAKALPPKRLADNLWSMTYFSLAPPTILPLPLWAQICGNCFIWREIGGNKLVLVSPPPPTEEVVQMISALGEISFAVSPGNGHDLYAHLWAQRVDGCKAACFQGLDHEPELKEWGRRVDVYSEDVLRPLGIQWHFVPRRAFIGAIGIGTKTGKTFVKEAIIQLPIQDLASSRPVTRSLAHSLTHSLAH